MVSKCFAKGQLGRRRVAARAASERIDEDLRRNGHFVSKSCEEGRRGTHEARRNVHGHQFLERHVVNGELAGDGRGTHLEEELAGVGNRQLDDPLRALATCTEVLADAHEEGRRDVRMHHPL